jgi:hypothetical protein
MNYYDFKQAIERYYLFLQDNIINDHLEAPHAMEAEKVSLNLDEETFQIILLDFIDKKELSDSEVYKKANITRQHFSKIRSDVFYVPKKETVMKFIIALELKVSDAEKILNAAGYAFATSFWLDVVILYCVENCVFDTMKIDQFLVEKGQPSLFSK